MSSTTEKIRYRWTPELADVQAADEGSGAFIQPHSWDEVRGRRVYDLPLRLVRPTEEPSEPARVAKPIWAYR